MAIPVFLTFIPDSGGLGTKVVTVQNVKEGLTVDINPERPVSSERTQDGALIDNTVEWNKDTLQISGVFYDVLFDIYLKALFVSGVTFTCKVWYIDGSFAEQTHYNATTAFSTPYRTNFDIRNNKFNISMTLREV